MGACGCDLQPLLETPERSIRITFWWVSFFNDCKRTEGCPERNFEFQCII